MLLCPPNIKTHSEVSITFEEYAGTNTRQSVRETQSQENADAPGATAGKDRPASAGDMV